MTFPCTIYLKDSSGRITKIVATGETTRSWVCGPKLSQYKYAKNKYAKNKYLETTAEEYEEFMWACRHGSKILDKIRYGSPDAALLRMIAKHIGYDDGEGKVTEGVRK